MQVVVATGKNSRIIGGAYAQGIKVAPMNPTVYVRQSSPQDVVMYGLLRGLQDAWHRARKLNLDWTYLDNGYLKPGHFDGHYSATINALQHTGAGDYERGKSRFEELDLGWKRLSPWKKTGDYILVLPPTEVFSGLMGFSPPPWIKDVRERLSHVTDRTIKIRAKPGSTLDGKVVPKGNTLEEDLEKAYAMVTYNSKAGIAAIVQGVPVFVSSPNCCASVSLSDLSRIEDPYYPDDRKRWLYALAANQFTLAELKTGYCHGVLEEDRKEGLTEVPLSGREINTLFT